MKLALTKFIDHTSGTRPTKIHECAIEHHGYLIMELNRAIFENRHG